MVAKDKLTMGLPGIKAKPGRPPSPTAKDGAARQKAYRERQAAKAKGELPSVFVSVEVMDALKGYVARQNMDRATDNLMSLGDAVDKILRDRLLRPR